MVKNVMIEHGAPTLADGQWMRDWEDRCKSVGATLVADGVMANNAPDDAALAECDSLGAALV